jgi:hypothetical protein
MKLINALMSTPARHLILAVGFAGSLAAAESQKQIITVTAGGKVGTDAPIIQKRIIVKGVEEGDEKTKSTAKEIAWLGVATEEPSEALGSQLGLPPGEGLLVTYVAPEGPAARAGLKKNDVLVRLDDQILLLPTQLRKLVQMRKEGDKVELRYYRGGKKESLGVPLGKTTARPALFGEDVSSPDERHRVRILLGDQLGATAALNGLDDLPVFMSNHGGGNHGAINVEVEREVERARAAVEKALRQTTNSHRLPRMAEQEIEELARSGVGVGKEASVTIHSQSREAKTMVKTDESGTYVLVATPKKRLTAHDPDGKVLFEGEIETSEQQDKVPRAVWEKVQPMLEKLAQPKTLENEPEKERVPGTQSATDPDPELPSSS